MGACNTVCCAPKEKESEIKGAETQSNVLKTKDIQRPSLKQKLPNG